MPKIITPKRREGETERAREYVKTHILFPSGLLGLIFMVAGTAALIHQLISEGYGWRPFLETSCLLLTGLAAGWAQTRYHQYLLRKFPAHFAARMKLFSQAPLRRQKREGLTQPLEHPGRALVPWAYLLGILAVLTGSAATAIFGHLYYVAAFFIPWIGFFWAKTFFWRGVLAESKK
jgi:hypothetical protein